MKTTINSLIELATISNNENRIELYKAMAQKLKNATKQEQNHLLKHFYANLCGLMAHSEMERNEYNKLNILLKHLQNICQASQQL